MNRCRQPLIDLEKKPPSPQKKGEWKENRAVSAHVVLTGYRGLKQEQHRGIDVYCRES